MMLSSDVALDVIQPRHSMEVIMTTLVWAGEFARPVCVCVGCRMTIPVAFVGKTFVALLVRAWERECMVAFMVPSNVSGRAHATGLGDTYLSLVGVVNSLPHASQLHAYILGPSFERQGCSTLAASFLGFLCFSAGGAAFSCSGRITGFGFSEYATTSGVWSSVGSIEQPSSV